MMLAVIPEWTQNLGDEIGRAWPIVVALIAGASATVWLYRIANRQLVAVVEMTMRPIADRVDSAGRKLDWLTAEFLPNGGDSMRDRQDQMHSKLDLVVVRSAQIDTALEVLWETAPEALYRTDQSGLVTTCNQAYLDLFGFDTPDAARSGDWLYLLTPTSQQIAQTRFASIVNEPRAFAYRSDLKDGRIFEFIGHPIKPDDVFHGYAGAVTCVGYWDKSKQPA